MNFSIETEWPPNIEKIRAVLPVTERNIFAYGNVIYNPGGGELPSWLIAHEKVHFRQQAEFTLKWWQKLNPVEFWWNRFLEDPEFRLRQELEAHRVEYRVFCGQVKDRNAQFAGLTEMAKRLAAPMYGGLITAAEARRMIQ